ncbi:MAG TPA: isoprenylcysteine carboxylmethyltransferase family protein, partial [Rhizomicrobium sp.]
GICFFFDISVASSSDPNEIPAMPDASPAKFQTTKAYDVLIAAPLILFYGFSMGGLLPQFAAASRAWPSWNSALQISALASNMSYFALVIALIFLRRMPAAKSKGPWPRVVALVGANLLVALLALPKIPLTPLRAALSTVLAGGGTVVEILILLWLGRSFSLLPEARRLVTTGPYRRIRHPLYLAGLVGSLGAMLQYRQPWALLIVLAALGFQIARMSYEEQVLRATFPEYGRYIARTWRLVPGVY